MACSDQGDLVATGAHLIVTAAAAGALSGARRRVDRDCETRRIGMHALSHDRGIAPAVAAA